MYVSRMVPSDITTITKELGICIETFNSAIDHPKSLGLVFGQTKVECLTRLCNPLAHKAKEAVKHPLSLEELLPEFIDAQKKEL